MIRLITTPDAKIINKKFYDKIKTEYLRTSKLYQHRHDDIMSFTYFYLMEKLQDVADDNDLYISALNHLYNKIDEDKFFKGLI